MDLDALNRKRGFLSLVKIVRQVEKIYQRQPVQSRGPFNLLEAVLEGTAIPERVSPKLTGRK